MPAPTSGAQTTAPSSSDTYEAGAESQVGSLAFVCTWSREEAHRTGEVGFVRPFEWLYGGRSDRKGKVLRFGPQRPGDPPHDFSRGRCLTGGAFSREQFLTRGTAVAIEVVNIGRHPMRVNGVKLPKFEGDAMVALGTPGAVARLKPGDRLSVPGEVSWVCVRRGRTLPVPEGYELHPFGEAGTHGAVGESEAMWNLLKSLMQAAARDGVHVLVLGETWTGKEMAGRFIHLNSVRAKGPYVSAVAIAESIAEAELFGNRANYPTPGTPYRAGLYGQANGGVLFLDELGDLPHKVQKALLHTLQNGEYRSVGEDFTRSSSVRAVAATSRDPREIHKDLYFRFIEKIHVPPLRERPEDIPLIARHLLVRQAETVPRLERFFRQGVGGRLEPNISQSFVDYLVGHPLPGNVRELESILIQALNQSTGDVIRGPEGHSIAPAPASTAPPPQSGAPVPASADGTLTEGTLRETLERSEWNVTKTGRILGMHRNAVQRLMDKYGIRKEEQEDKRDKEE